MLWKYSSGELSWHEIISENTPWQVHILSDWTRYAFGELTEACCCTAPEKHHSSAEEFPPGSWLPLGVPGCWGKQLSQIALFVWLTDLSLLVLVQCMAVAKCMVVPFHFLPFLHCVTLVPSLLRSHRVVSVANWVALIVAYKLDGNEEVAKQIARG